MNENGYVKFILTVAVAVIALFGYLGVRALDRVRESNLRVVERLDALREQLSDSPVSTVTAVRAAEPKDELPPPAAANQEFFDPASQIGGRMIQAIGADTANLNSIINNDALASSLNGLCVPSLAERNFRNPEEFQPMLAESWEISPDHLSYRVKLRRGVYWDDVTDPVTGKFHRNVEVTAADFKFYVDVVRDPSVNCEQLRNYLQDLDSVEIINPYEFVVRWKKAYYGSYNVTLSMTPLPRHFFDYDGKFDGAKFNNDHLRNRMIVGCGPYRFVRWDKDQRVIFQRNSRYFGIRLGIAPALEYQVFDIIKLPNTRFQALLGGKLDQLGLTPDQWTQRTDTAEFTTQFDKYKYLLPQYTYIGYNLRNPLFQDKRVRQALTMLVDREKILKEVYFGLAKIVTGPFFSEGRYNDSSIRPWPYDPAQARKQLAEAGWRDTDGDGILEKDGRKFTFTMLQIASHPIQQRMMPMLKEFFAAGGIDMKIQNVEWSVYLQRLDQRSYEACSLGWASPFEPDLYQVFHSSQADVPGGSNFVYFKDAAADRLIEELRSTFDPARRVKLSHELCRIFHEEQPYTFLFAPYSLTALSKRYRNVRVFPVGVPEVILWTPRGEQRSVPGL